MSDKTIINQPLHNVKLQKKIAVFQLQKIISNKNMANKKDDSKKIKQYKKTLPLLFSNMIYQSYASGTLSNAKVVYTDSNE